jgi:AAA+ superfamily predicted ATPase
MKGMKGFIFCGESGAGKTHMARMVAHELGVPLLYIDSAIITGWRSGDYERLVSKLFEEARHNRALLLFDDVEALLSDRTSKSIEGSNTAMDKVMFHRLDDLDTSKCSVIVITDRIALLDKGLIDRLSLIEFQLPSLETLLAVAQQRCADVKMGSEGVERRIRLMREDFRSMGAVEKAVMDEYLTRMANGHTKGVLLAERSHERIMVQ